MVLALSTGTGTGLVEKIQTVSGTIGSGASSVDLTIDNVDLTRAVLDPSLKGGTATPNTGNVNVRFVDSNTIRAERSTTGTAVEVSVIVTEFASQVSVQNVYNTDTLGNATDTINAVDLTSSVCRMNGMERAGNSFTNDDCNRVSFQDATTVLWRGDATTSNDQIVACQVIDFGPGASVQSGTEEELGASVITRIDVGIATVDPDSSLAMASMETAQGAARFEFYLWNFFLVDEQTVRFERSTQGNYDYWWDWFVVTFDPGILKVQRGVETMASTTSSADVTIDAVDLEKTSVRISGTLNGMSFARVDDTNDDTAEALVQAVFSDDSTLNLSRTASTQNANPRYEVIEWLLPLTPSPQLLAGPIAGTGAGGGDIDFGPETATETESAALDGVEFKLGAQTADEVESATLDAVQFKLGTQTADETESATLDGVEFKLGAQTSEEVESATLDGVQFKLGAQTADDTESATLGGVRFELDLSATDTESASLTQRVVEDYYPYSNYASDIILGPAVLGTAQAWEGQGNRLVGAAFWIKKTGSPVGTISCKLYSTAGTYGTSAAPNGTALATSVDTIDEGDLSTSYQRFEFAFDYELSDATYYALTVEASAGTYSSGNSFEVAADNAASTHPGNYAVYVGASWIGTSSADLCFQALCSLVSGDIDFGPETASETESATLSGVTILLPSLSATESESASLDGVTFELDLSATEVESATLDQSGMTFSLSLSATEDATATLSSLGVDLGTLLAAVDGVSTLDGVTFELDLSADEVGSATLSGVTGVLETYTLQKFGRYHVFNPDKSSEAALRKLAWLRNRTK